MSASFPPAADFLLRMKLLFMHHQSLHTVYFDSVICVSPLSPYFLFTGLSSLAPCRSHLGQSQPGRADLHRVLGDPSEPGDSPVSRSVAGPGRLARGAHTSPGCHRKPHGQQHLGELHPGQDQTHTQRNTVGSTTFI